MIQRLFIPKRTIHHRDLKPIGVVEFLGFVILLAIVMKVSPSMETVLLKFYSNMTKGMGDHASLLAYLLRSNQDRHASVTTTLASLDFVVPRPSPTPSVVGASTQPVGSGDTERLGYSDSEL